MERAILAGHVFDSSGRNIPGVRLELLDVNHNTSLTTQTDSQGRYTFPSVMPGSYRLQLSALGFRTLIVVGLNIDTEDRLQKIFKLAVGSASESLTVQANGAPIENSQSVSTVVDQRLVTELPLNGRSFQTLFQLTPGVVITATNFASQGQFSVNGQRSNANYLLIDGVSANVAIAAGVNPGQSAGGSLPAVSAFGGTNSLVSTNDVYEFAILTSSY